MTDPAAQNSPQNISLQLLILVMDVVGDIYVPYDHPTIQGAIDAADPNDTIIVSPGTYIENINFNGKNIILTSTDPEDPDIVASTVIDGNESGSVVTFSGSETSDCELKGFTITNGYIDSASGGGVRGNGTLATIDSCIITQNEISDMSESGRYGGGGLWSCDGLIKNCVISYNNARGGTYNGASGGGLLDCNGIIIGCTINGNWAQNGTGGLWSRNGSIINCMIADNGSSGVRTDGLISNCVITGHFHGIYHSDGSITNCTIVGNERGISYCDVAIITNCIVWGNTDQLYESSIPTYSCIQDWVGGGVGNNPGDPNEPDYPFFVDVTNGDYHLKSDYGRWDPVILEWVYDAVTSPCIDAGDPNSIEWQNELWPHGGRINMGAYGGTPQASMSPNPVGNAADLDHNDTVDVSDFWLLSDDWLWAEYLLDTDLNRNGKVDIADFADFALQWLWQEP